MADFKYIMQGFQKDINFFDEIKEVLETEDYTSIWILTAFVNERAICNLMPSIKKSKADISFIIGIRNNVSTYQALKCLINMKVSVFVFDTARIESIFHAKVIVGSGTNSAKVICGSANITTGGLANNIEAGIISKLNLRCESDEKFLTEVREYIDNIIHNYPQNVKKISEDRELDELYEQGLVVDENQRKLRNNFFCASKEKQEKSIVSRFPLVNKKLLNFGKKQKQTNAILRKLDQVIVEEVCEEVWKSNKLTKSHLGIVKKGTHAKGEMSLGKEIDEKPIILCSDCHDPRKYSAKESLWIKANVTFEGLKQCIFQPSERVYVGTIPAAVDRVNKNKKANIDSLSVHRIIEPKNDGVSWFDFDISLNAGLVAVIGNKGSGKSAFSDITRR